MGAKRLASIIGAAHTIGLRTCTTHYVACAVGLSGGSNTCTENSGAASLVKKFQALQQERTQTYAMFDEGHKAYLASSPNYNFPMYRQLVHEITQAFKHISEEIISLQQSLHGDFDHVELAKIVGKIQDEEQKKLELTVTLQLAEQNVLDHKDDETFKQEVLKTKESIKEVTEKINEHLDDFKYESEDLMT